MKLYIILAALSVAMMTQGCGDSNFNDTSSSTSEVDVFQMPKADCGGDPCL